MLTQIRTDLVSSVNKQTNKQTNKRINKQTISNLDPKQDPSKQGLRLLYTANSSFYDYKEPQVPKPSLQQTYPPSIPIDKLYPERIFPKGMELPYYSPDGKTLRSVDFEAAKVKEKLDDETYQVSLLHRINNNKRCYVLIPLERISK